MLMIRLFPRSLTDQAMEWYFTLPRSEILLVEMRTQRKDSIDPEILVRTFHPARGRSFTSAFDPPPNLSFPKRLLLRVYFEEAS